MLYLLILIIVYGAIIEEYRIMQLKNRIELKDRQLDILEKIELWRF